MDCPVCNKKNIALVSSKCPQCDSDLRSLEDLRKLRGALPGVSRKKWVAILFTLLISLNFIVILLLFDANQTIGIYSEYETKMQDSLNRSAERIEKLLLAKNQEIKDNSKKITYRVKRNDSLWKIAKIFYGKGSDFFKIKENNKLNSDFLSVGQTLKITFE